MTKTPNGSRERVSSNALVLRLLLLSGLSVYADPQTQAPTEAAAQRPFQLSVNVDLVVLNATVRDQKGQISTDLREQDFEVYENGVRQTIRLFRHEDIPVTVGLVVDHSGSMKRKLGDVIAAARSFVQSSSPQDEMFVVNFNEHVTLGLPASIPLSNRPEDLTGAISDMPATGKTALYDAVFKAREQLRSGTLDKKVLIVISDGGDNASSHSLAEVLSLATLSGVLMYTIGIFDDDDPDKNPGVLRQLALATGGEAYFPRQYKDVIAICEGIARDIRHQYTIGYFSDQSLSKNAAHPGPWRAIRVAARATGKDKLLVRTRSGYMAGGESKAVTHERVK